MNANMAGAIEALDRSGIRYRIATDSTDEAISGAKTCEALGASPERVFKSILFLSNRRYSRRSILLIPADRKLDMKKAEAAVGAPGRPAGKAETLRDTGFQKGFFGPLCRGAFPVLIDASARKWDSVFINAGGRGNYIELRAEDLLTVTGGRFADLAGGLSTEQFARNRALPVSTVIQNYRITAVSAVYPLEIIYRGEDTLTGRVVDICEWFPDRTEHHSARAADGVTVRMLVRTSDLARGFRPDPRETEHLRLFQSAVLSHGRAMAALAFPKAPAISAVVPANRTVYSIVEHVEGERLSDRVRRTGPLDWPTAQSLLYPLLNQIEASGKGRELLSSIRPDTVLLRERDALLLTYSAPTGILGTGGGLRFCSDDGYDPYIWDNGNVDAVSLFCSVIYYALTGRPHHRSTDDPAKHILGLERVGMPEAEAKRLLARIT